MVTAVGQLFGAEGFVSFPGFIAGALAVGITSGASVPEILVKGVVEYLDGEGFHDVKPVTTANETLVFALPRELRPRAKA